MAKHDVLGYAQNVGIADAMIKNAPAVQALYFIREADTATLSVSSIHHAALPHIMFREAKRIILGEAQNIIFVRSTKPPPRFCIST